MTSASNFEKEEHLSLTIKVTKYEEELRKIKESYKFLIIII